MRWHTAAPRAGLFTLALALLAAPAWAGGPAGDRVDGPAAGDAEGVVTLTDLAPAARSAVKTTHNADAAVRPAGLLGGGETGCGDGTCEGGCRPGGAFGEGGCPNGACGDGSCPNGACGDGSCRSCGPTFTLPGRCLLADRGLCCPKCGTRCGPGGTCGACGAAGVPCGPGLCLPGLPCLGVPGVCLPGGCLPGGCLPGGCLPGACLGGCLPGLLPRGIPYWGADGGPQACYLCSLLGIGADACGDRHGLIGRYDHVYALNPGYTDRREGQVWAAAGSNVPTAVPLAPNVRHTMEYGWGMPSSRLVPVSRPAPPSYLYGPPEGTQVELPRTRHPRTQTLPIIPEKRPGLPRTGVAFPYEHGSQHIR